MSRRRSPCAISEVVLELELKRLQIAADGAALQQQGTATLCSPVRLHTFASIAQALMMLAFIPGFGAGSKVRSSEHGACHASLILKDVTGLSSNSCALSWMARNQQFFLCRVSGAPVGFCTGCGWCCSQHVIGDRPGCQTSTHRTDVILRKSMAHACFGQAHRMLAVDCALCSIVTFCTGHSFMGSAIGGLLTASAYGWWCGLRQAGSACAGKRSASTEISSHSSASSGLKL